MGNITTIYIVRHGETEYNRDRKIQGQVDSPLTEAGLEQVCAVRDELKDVHFDAAFSSDLLRAKRTAEIITLEKKLAITTSKQLRERHYGPFEGKSYDDFQIEYKKLWDKFQDLSEEDRFKKKILDNMESEEEAVSRYITFLREVAVSHSGKTVLVGSHGGIMKAFLVHLGLAPYSMMSLGLVQNCGYIKVETDGIDFHIKETKRITIPQ